MAGLLSWHAGNLNPSEEKGLELAPCTLQARRPPLTNLREALLTKICPSLPGCFTRETVAAFTILTIHFLWVDAIFC